jgi:hypothetical protein
MATFSRSQELKRTSTFKSKLQEALLIDKKVKAWIIYRSICVWGDKTNLE